MGQNDAAGRTLSTTGTDSSERPRPGSEILSRTHQEGSQGVNVVGQEDMAIQRDNMPLEGQDRTGPSEAMDSLAIQIGSTTLARLPASKRPNPSTVCEGCPAAMWYARGEKILNYCRIMHLISWETGEKEPVTSCDGPAIASQ